LDTVFLSWLAEHCYETPYALPHPAVDMRTTKADDRSITTFGRY